MYSLKSLYSESKVFHFNSDQEISFVDTIKGKSTIVLIHGMGSSLECWLKIVAELRKKYRCIILDLPGYGSSKNSSKNFSIDYCIDIINSLLQHLQINSCTLLGHSMGGQIAIKLIGKCSVLINKLLLVSPAGLEQFDSKDMEWISKNITTKSMYAFSKKDVVKMVSKNFHNQNLNIEILLNQRLKIMDDDETNYKYCETIVQSYYAMLQEKTLPLIKKIQIPTYIIFGEDDFYIPHRILHKEMKLSDVLKSAAAIFKNYHIETISHCGHFPQWEKPNEVLEFVYRSIKE